MTNGAHVRDGVGHRDIDFTSDVVQPGREAFVILGVPNGLLPLKVEVYPDSAAHFTVVKLGDLSTEDAHGYTQGRCDRAGFLKVKNTSPRPASFRCCVRVVPDTAKIESDIARSVEEAWRRGTSQ